MISRTSLAVYLICCISTAARAEEDPLTKVLLEHETALAEAIKNHDREKYEAMLHDQTMAVLDGKRLSTEQVLASLPKRKIVAYEISNAKALPMNDGAAILSYKYTWTGGIVGGEMKQHIVYSTAVWAKHEGKWKSFFYQETPVAE